MPYLCIVKQKGKENMKAYKGFNRNYNGKLYCRDFIYKPGKTYKYKGELVICESGFHACHELYQCFQHYENDGKNVFYEVECGGQIIKNRSKLVCSEITLVREIDVSGVPLFSSAYYLEDYEILLVAKGDSLRNTRQYNYLNKDLKLLSDEWFDDLELFSSGFSKIKINGQYNFIDIKGNLLSDECFKHANSFQGAYAEVWKGEYEYLISCTGKLCNNYSEIF